jgi:hypothetical protein
LSANTPFRQVKPEVQSFVPLPLAVIWNAVVETVELGRLKNAQMPPQIIAPFRAVVGLADTVKEVAVGAGVDSTVVFAANFPVPE